MKFVSIIFVLSLLIGCGFQLRGTEQVVFLDFHSIYIETGDIHGDIHRILKDKFQQSKVEVSADSSEAQYTVLITDERNSRRAIAHSSSQIVTEYEIAQEVSLHLVNKEGDYLISQEKVSAERFYALNDQILDSSFQEERLLREEMQQDLSEQIFRRVSAGIQGYENKKN